MTAPRTDWMAGLPPALRDQAERNLAAVRRGLSAHRDRNAAETAACLRPRRTRAVRRLDGSLRAGVLPCGNCDACRGADR